LAVHNGRYARYSRRLKETSTPSIDQLQGTVYEPRYRPGCAEVISPSRLCVPPTPVAHAGERASERFIEFFTANIRNKNTRLAYAGAVYQFFDWCDGRGLGLQDLKPTHIAGYIERQLGARPTVKQQLAAIRMLFDYLVTGGVLPINPAASVRGPKHVVKRGKSPVLTADQARQLLDSIETSSMVGLRDRAMIAVMVYSFARVSAVVTMKVEDYYQNGKRWWFRLHEKGGKRHEVPAHLNAEAYMDAYLEAGHLWQEKKGPLFRSVDRHRELSERPMHRNDVLEMIKRRAKETGLPDSTCCHTFRATGITAYLENGGTIENAQAIAAHESPKTTKLYDRTGDEITLDEVEKIAI
jgi:integrase/recombinase XerD